MKHRSRSSPLGSWIGLEVEKGRAEHDIEADHRLKLFMGYGAIILLLSGITIYAAIGSVLLMAPTATTTTDFLTNSTILSVTLSNAQNDHLSFAKQASRYSIELSAVLAFLYILCDMIESADVKCLAKLTDKQRSLTPPKNLGGNKKASR